MKFVVTKASTGEMKIKTFNTVSDLTNFMEQIRFDIIIGHNFLYETDIPSIMKWNEVDEKKAQEISKIEYEITIYDTYIE